MSAEFDQLVAQFEQFQAKLHRVDQQVAGIGEMQRDWPRWRWWPPRRTVR